MTFFVWWFLILPETETHVKFNKVYTLADLLNRLSQNQELFINSSSLSTNAKSQLLPPARSCVRLWQRGQHPGTPRRLWAVWGLCGRRLTRRLFLGGISRGENNMGSGTRAAVLWVKSGSFGQPKKVLDKGRWSLATTSRPQSPAVRGFPGFWYRRRFSRFSKSRWTVGQKIQRFQAVAPCRSGTNIVPL